MSSLRAAGSTLAAFQISGGGLPGDCVAAFPDLFDAAALNTQTIEIRGTLAIRKSLVRQSSSADRAPGALPRAQVEVANMYSDANLVVAPEGIPNSGSTNGAIKSRMFDSTGWAWDSSLRIE